MKNSVKSRENQLTNFSVIKEAQPQAAFLPFANALRKKLSYFVRTNSNIRPLLLPLERIIRSTFIPALTRGHICNYKKYHYFLTNQIRQIGSSIMKSNKITLAHTISIKQQILQYKINEDNLKKFKTEVKKSKKENNKVFIEKILTQMNDKGKHLVDLSTQTGVSNWLMILSITEFGFELYLSSSSGIQSDYFVAGK